MGFVISLFILYSCLFSAVDRLNCKNSVKKRLLQKYLFMLFVYLNRDRSFNNKKKNQFLKTDKE
jgi:hypothetical protein